MVKLLRNFGMVNTNITRLTDAAEEVHSALSKMDTNQYNLFMKTDIGQAYKLIANSYANESHGARFFGDSV